MENAQLYFGSSNSTLVPDVVPSNWQLLESAALGDVQVIAAPVAGQRIRLLYYRITSTGLLAALGTLDARFKDSGGLLPFAQSFVLPAALAASMTAPHSPVVRIIGGYPLVTASALTINLSVALASGLTRIEVGYMLEVTPT